MALVPVLSRLLEIIPVTTKTRAWTKDKFDKLAMETRLAESAFSSFRIAMDCRYGNGVTRMHWKPSDSKQYGKLRDKYDKLYNRLISAIRDISPRSWESGIPCYWIVENINYDMATTLGQIEPIPPRSWGSVQDNTQWAKPIV